MKHDTTDSENQCNLTEKLNTNSLQEGDMLEKVLNHVGSMGRYQRILIICMMPFGFTFAFVYLVQIFITVTPQKYWCKIPELANLSTEMRQNLSSPSIGLGMWDHCKTFDTNWTQVLNTLTVPPPGTPTVPCQCGWEFELSDIPYETVVTEREWVCDRANNVPIAQSVFFGGAVLGSFTSGWIADRFGRIPAIIGTNLLAGIGGIATTFTKGAWDFIFCRFIVGLGFDNCFWLIYILLLEYIGPQYRTLVANVFLASTYGVAATALPWIALYVSNWRLLLWVTSLPMFLVVLAKWIMPESIRWLVSCNRVNEAVVNLKRVESINGAKIPDDVMDEFIILFNKAKFEKKLSIIDLLRNPVLRVLMFKMILVYAGNFVVFDGLMRLSDTFGLSFFIVFTYNEVIEFMAILIVAAILDRYGRRSLTCFPIVLCGILLFTSMFMAKGLTLVTLALVARFFMILCLTTTMQWCTKILPTPFRVSGSSMLHITCFVTSVLSTFITFSERIWTGLPYLIFTIAAFCTSWIFLTLPETKGQPLPQTLSDLEKLIEKHSLCGKPEGSEDGPYK